MPRDAFFRPWSPIGPIAPDTENEVTNWTCTHYDLYHRLPCMTVLQAQRVIDLASALHRRTLIRARASATSPH